MENTFACAVWFIRDNEYDRPIPLFNMKTIEEAAQWIEANEALLDDDNRFVIDKPVTF